MIFFELYGILVLLIFAFIMFYLQIARLIFPNQRILPKRSTSIFLHIKSITETDNLNTIVFWGTMTVSIFILKFIINIYILTNGVLINCFLYLSWAVLLILLITYNKKQLDFTFLDKISIIMIISGGIYQFFNLFLPNKNILTGIDRYLHSGTSFSVSLNAIYYFLTTNIVLSFFGCFIIQKQIDKSRDIKSIKYINYKGTDKIVTILSLSLSLIISLLLIGMEPKQLSVISGVVLAAVAFSLRDLIGNFIAGLILLWDDSIKQNNVISIQNYLSDYDEEPYGWIDEINMRYTVVKDRNNINLIIPNTVLISNPIINWTQYDNSVRIRLDVGISYNSDLEKAIKVIPLACRDEDRVLKESRYSPKVNVMRFNDSSIDLQLRFYIKDPKNGIRNIKSKIFRNVVKILKDNDIEIPYPQSDVHLDFNNSVVKDS